jgi:2-haloacid dehalogenase
MPLDRRGLLSLGAGSLALGLATTGPPARAYQERRTKALLFDAFPVFDPRPVFALAEEIFPGKGSELGGAWRTRQFEYTWLRALAHRYEDFWKVTEDALVFAARALKLDLDRAKRERLMDAYLKLRAYPDVAPALGSLRGAGIRLGFLSNLTPRMLDSAVAGSGLGDFFEHVLSTDKLKTYKPDPRAYQMGIDAFGLGRDEISFIAFAGWDASGAKWFGYRTIWVNRLKQPGEELGVAPDATCENLAELVKLVL